MDKKTWKEALGNTEMTDAELKEELVQRGLGKDEVAILSTMSLLGGASSVETLKVALANYNPNQPRRS